MRRSTLTQSRYLHIKITEGLMLDVSATFSYTGTRLWLLMSPKLPYRHIRSHRRSVSFLRYRSCTVYSMVDSIVLCDTPHRARTGVTTSRILHRYEKLYVNTCVYRKLAMRSVRTSRTRKVYSYKKAPTTELSRAKNQPRHSIL